MIYIILDIEHARQVGSYREEADALAEVREAVGRFGRGYAAEWALASKDERGAVTAIAEGDALIDRALAAEAKA